MKMSCTASSFLLIHVMLVCPTMLTPVTFMTNGGGVVRAGGGEGESGGGRSSGVSGGAAGGAVIGTVGGSGGDTGGSGGGVSVGGRGGADEGRVSPFYSQMRAEFQANKDRVLKILGEPEWYRAFLEMLRQELRKKGDHRIEVARFYMHLIDRTPRIRRSVAPHSVWEEQLTEPPGIPSRSQPSGREGPSVEVTAALKVDGKLQLTVNKTAKVTRMGDSNEIIKTEIGNTEIQLSMKVTKKGTAAAPAPSTSADATASGLPSPMMPPSISGDSQDGRPRPPPPPPPSSATASPRPSAALPPSSAYEAAADAAEAAAAAAAGVAGAARNGSGEASWKGVCTDKNFCLFGGECKHYSIINIQLCSCRKGYKGTRCELYDINEVLGTLESAQKRRVIGNGPIDQGGDHMDVMSVVESTAIYLLQIPKSYSRSQGMQVIESLLRN